MHAHAERAMPSQAAASPRSACERRRERPARHSSAARLSSPSAAACPGLQLAGGPEVPMRYGRKDGNPEDVAPEGNLPGAGAPFADGSQTPAEHLRKVRPGPGPPALAAGGVGDGGRRARREGGGGA